APQPVDSQAELAADDSIEVALAQRRRQRQEKSAGFCPQCGGPVQKSDRFCPKCGTVLSN
ncbi:MAG TPA: zinc ribbon domain-containing protein, partial [Anaerolineales bacterium]|nr:zinc ribbon domain-containing protein [Anaerolineales bacterium]